MVLMEESVYRCDTIDFDKKSQHNFARIKNEYYFFRLKLPAILSVFQALKAGEVIVKSTPHFCLQGIYFY